MTLVRPSTHFNLVDQILLLVNGGLTDENFDGSSLNGGRLLQAGSVSDTELASPNNVVYKRLVLGGNPYSGGIVSTSTTYYPSWLGTGWTQSGTGTLSPVFFSIVAADLAVAGKTTHMRTRVTVAANADANSPIVTLGLYSVTFGGTGASMTLTAAGSAVTSSTCTANPTASNVATNASAAFDVPSDGAYTLGIRLSAAVTGFIQVIYALEYHHV